MADSTPSAAENAKSAKGQAQSSASAASVPTASPARPSGELTGAQKKAAAKAEKAARRAAKVEQKDVPAGPSTNGDSTPKVTAAKGGQQTQSQKSNGQQQQKESSTPKQRRPSVAVPSVQVRDLPERVRRGSRGGLPSEQKKGPSKEVTFFSHLYGQPKKHTLEGSAREVHPSVLELGLQLSTYTICGSQARCIAMLLALKSFIMSYTTPPSTSLPRHLSSTALSPQLTHLKTSRPFSVTQSNAIRWLKNLIATIDPSTPEPTAKSYISNSIDTFVRERFTVADRVIASSAGERIRQEDDVILTYAKSAVVTSTLLEAWKRGKRFRVICVDSRPLFEGKALTRTLANHGIPVTYCLTSGLAHAVQDATSCLLGAHAVLGNGAIYSRVGTSLVGLAARERGVPVVVCAESVKFTERVALDSIVGNELAPEEELLFDTLPETPKPTTADAPTGKNATGGGKGSKLKPAAAKADEDKEDEKPAGVAGLMKDWREKDNLQILNIMHDVLPPEYVDMIITEHGNLPPNCAPVVGRMNIGG